MLNYVLTKWFLEYQYAMNTAQRIASLEKVLNIKSRRSVLYGVGAKTLWHMLQRERRKLKSGHGMHLSHIETLYDRPSPLLSRIKKSA